MLFEKIIIGAVFLIIGLILILFNKFLGKHSLLEHPSVLEITFNKYNKNKRVFYRTLFIKITGIIFIILGVAIIFIYNFYQS